jgi:hypothetical protein
MFPRLAMFLTPALLMAGSADADDAAWFVQQIHDQAYGKCMSDGRFGAGSALQANCSCSADVVVDQLSKDYLHAIAEGTQARFKGPKLQGDAASFNAALLKACPGIGPYL